ncbi:MAG: hypothetical protein ACLP50_30600 [Solirubrobacteraceae bacterium]
MLEATDYHPGRSGRDHLRMLGRAVDVPDSRVDRYRPFAARARCTDRLHEIVLPFSGRGAYLAYFAGPIDYHLGLLDRVLEREDDARRRFADALAFCRRLGAPRWAARSRVALAEPRREEPSRTTARSAPREPERPENGISHRAASGRSRTSSAPGPQPFTRPS